jgi:hypothetical protein
MNSPYGFTNGGMVHEMQAHLPAEMLPRNDPDRVLARLQPGELVIPVKHTALVAAFLRSKGIILPNM